MSGLLAIFQDANGNNSSMRILVFIVVITILINWTIVNIQTGTMTAMPWEQVVAIVGSLFAKGYQKANE